MADTIKTIGSIVLKSPAFVEGDMIPARYTCDGRDIIPPLEFENIPPEAKSLVIVLDDPDSPTGVWDHWVIFNVTPVSSIDEAQEPQGVQGGNSWGRMGYGGPCPGRGQHRYVFRVYALDTELPLASGAVRSEIDKAMQGHVLAQGELMGRYERKREE